LTDLLIHELLDQLILQYIFQFLVAQQVSVVIRSMNITIEEEQLLRVISLLGLGAPEAEPDSTAMAARAEPTEYESPHRGHTPSTTTTEQVSRYFVANLCIIPEQVSLLQCCVM
jgi:hypothetical protein